MSESLKEHLQKSCIVERLRTPFGMKYTVIGAMKAPDGSAPTVKSVWIILSGEVHPKLVTAFLRV